MLPFDIIAKHPVLPLYWTPHECYYLILSPIITAPLLSWSLWQPPSFSVNKCHFARSITPPLMISLSLFPIVTCKFQWLIFLLFQTLSFQICIFHPPVHNWFYILLCLPFIILEFYSWEKAESSSPALNTFVFPFHRPRNLFSGTDSNTWLLKVDNLKYSHVSLLA